MKRLFLTFLLAWGCLTGLYSEFLIPLNGGISFATGDISEPYVVKTSDTELFFFYIKNGNLLVLQSIDNGESFSLIDIAGLGIADVEKMSLHSGVNERPFLLVQATRNGIYGLYSLLFNDSGQLFVAFDKTLTLDTISGNVSLYMLIPGNKLTFLLLYIKNNKFCTTYFSLINNTVDKYTISTEGKVVTDFKAYIYFESSLFIYYGLYFTEENGNLFLNYFELFNTTVTRNEIIYEHPLPQNLYFELFKTSNNETFFNYLIGTSIYGKKLTVGTWNVINNGESVTDLIPVGVVTPYYKEISKERTFTGFSVTENTINSLYLAERNENNIILPLTTSMKVNDISFAGIPIVQPIYSEILLTGFLEPVNSRNIVVVKIKSENVINTILCPDQVIAAQEVTEFSFYLATNGKFILYEKIIDGNITIIQFYEINNIENGFNKQYTLVFPESEGSIMNIQLENDVCFIFFTDKTVLIDISTWMSETMIALDFHVAKDNDKEKDYMVNSVGVNNFLYGMVLQDVEPINKTQPGEILIITDSGE